MNNSDDKKPASQEGSAKGQASGEGFGTFKGVFIPSTLTILGVILYLRMGWVVGNAGLLGSILIISMASIITFVTALSISATATNMKVKGGGAYFMISRSFGIEAGAAIGLPLYLAQSLGISFYISGFAESIQPFFPEFDLRAIALLSLGALFILAYISADLALRAQILVFLVIVASLLSFLFGSPVTEAASDGAAKLEQGASFWMVFAIFFPAVTGIEAGISMSGDLKKPSKSLPQGTVMAVICGYVVYLLVAFVLWSYAPDSVLTTNPMVMASIALVPAAIYVGIWGATLSSALGAMLGAPRTLQALSKDQVAPAWLGQGFGKNNDPRIATVFTFGLAVLGIFLGGLDAIAPVLSMFFLTSYGFLNLIAGLEGLIGNPSWRPSFRTPWIVSLGGAAACFATMLMINAGAALIALVCVVGIFVAMQKKRVNVSWSDMRRAILLFLARSSIYRLADFEKDARTWRPNMLVLSGSPTARWYLIELADAISHGKGFLTVCSIVTQRLEEDKVESIEKSIQEFLRKRQVPALVKVKCSDDIMSSIHGLVDDYGLGPLVPNTIVFGETEKAENFEDFVGAVRAIHAENRNVLIVREDRRKEQRDRVYRKDKQIDVWWGRKHSNANLMLAMGYMLQTSPEWMGSELRLKSLVKTEEERQGVAENLVNLIKESRLNAGVQVYVANEDEDPFETIARNSKDAELVFVGMRPPDLEEPIEEYQSYYENLLDKTQKFPYLVITLAGETIEFKEIFR